MPAKIKEEAPVFTKQEIVQSKSFSSRVDAVNALLVDGKSYTLDQVEKIIDKFMKGKVN